MAQTLHKLLEEIEVPSFCKTSGATGLHISVPLGVKKMGDLYAPVLEKGIDLRAALHNIAKIES